MPLKWFTSYLMNRTQYVKINNAISDPNSVSCGVPQRSTLGPVLFLLYINDLPQTSNKLLFRMFADDTNIFYSHKDINVIEDVVNTEIKHVFDYCIVNKLTVNFKKTHFILFKSSRKNVLILLFLRLNNVTILSTYEFTLTITLNGNNILNLFIVKFQKP